MIKKFIAFEGPDVVGKSSLIAMAKNYFISKNIAVQLTREPGGNETAEELRKIILNNELNKVSEALLFAAARIESIDNKVIPLINEGNVVLSDRCYISSIVYQGYGNNIFHLVKDIHERTVTRNRDPELILIFDLNDEEAEKRLLNRFKNLPEDINRFDINGKQKFYREKYKSIVGNNIIHIDANGTLEENFEKLKVVLDNYIDSNLKANE